MITLTRDNKMLGYELLSLYPNISHFVTTRHGGLSKESYGTFNCSPYCGDNPRLVEANQKILCSELPVSTDRLVFPRQVHGTKVALLDSDFLKCTASQRSQLLDGVDALITGYAGYCLCISTADCVPVLIYDDECRVVAAVHAGWRGTVNQIVSRTLWEMSRLFGSRGSSIHAVIGPSISKEAFEVGEEVYEAFNKQGFRMEEISFRNEHTGKYHIDLWEANKHQLSAFGVQEDQIQVAGICTYTHHEDYYSARRLGIASGRIVSGIMLNE